MKMTALATLSVAMLAAPISVAAAQEWNGLYVGGHVGYGFLHDKDETVVFDTNLDGRYGDTVNTTAPANAFSPGFCDGAANGNNAGAGCSDDEGGVDAGVRIGYDRQFGSWVFGGVAEWSYLDISDNVSAFSTTPASYQFTRDVNSVIGLRGRAGYSFGTMLPYATAGVAFADVDNGFRTTNTANSFTQSGGDDAKGYQLGGGAEWALSPRIRLGAEYLYTSVEIDDFTVRAGNSGTTPATNPFLLVNTSGTDFRRSEEDFDFSTVRFTVSYRFGQ